MHVQAAPVPVTASSGKMNASPLAKRLAAQKGIDLASVRGTGYEGRIVAADILEFKGAAAPGVSATAAVSAGSQEDAFGYYEDIPNSNMRKVIGKRLLESKTTIPHYYLTIELNVDKLMK